MADVVVEGADDALDLEDLNRWIHARESIAAPVVAIGRGVGKQGDPQTAISLDYDQRRPTNKARVVVLVGDIPVVAGDELLVCKGKAYISGVLTSVFLVRKKP